MKKLSLIIASSLLALAASAQGVFSANNNFTPGGASAIAYVLGINGLPLPKANGRVVILNQANLLPLNPEGTAGKAFFKDGLFTVSDIVVPGVPVGGAAQIIVQSWDFSTGATYAAATVKAQGLVVVNNLGGGLTPNATFAADSNFVGLTLVDTIPEPSTVALAGLGLVGLLFVARRK